VPIIVWGSQLVIKLVDRYPSVILVGGAVLCWTAYGMIVREPMLLSWFEAHPAAKLILAVLAFSIALAPWYNERLSDQMKPLTLLLPTVLIWMLAFEVAGTVWKVQADYLMATTQGEYLMEGVRWIGWLPFAALLLWVRERLVLRSARVARSAQ
jgi:hypothetical protein